MSARLITKLLNFCGTVQYRYNGSKYNGILGFLLNL